MDINIILYEKQPGEEDGEGAHEEVAAELILKKEN